MTEEESAEYCWNVLSRRNHTNYGDIDMGLHHYRLLPWTPMAVSAPPTACGWEVQPPIRMLRTIWYDVFCESLNPRRYRASF